MVEVETLDFTLFFNVVTELISYIFYYYDVKLP